MDDILNAGLSNQNELNTNPDLDNKPEVPYSDIGKTVSANRPVDPMAALNTSSVANPLMPTIDLKNYTRYTSSDAFPKIGINPALSQEQLERQFDANQSYGEAFGNMVGKFWNKTSNSFTDFFRADFTTNDQLIKHMYDELKDEQAYDLYNPSFDSRSKETKESFLQWIPGFEGSLDNYEQFLPNLGYTAGMMGAGIVQNFITGKALTGLGAIAGVAETAYEGNQLMNLIYSFKCLQNPLSVEDCEEDELLEVYEKEVEFSLESDNVGNNNSEIVSTIDICDEFPEKNQLVSLISGYSEVFSSLTSEGMRVPPMEVKLKDTSNLMKISTM